ncbi:putative MAPEG family protein [Lyophyllum shimeji]|uniref:MAPEG family protein n=1 Tax=Lyophyllum shimeji TaxID=47721 RepID=A0A9P3PM51_LYOSH|nr:putative MAPEG family protein [Lyophyllum shimeji]
MSTVVTVPQGSHYTFTVSRWRRRAGIKYPQLYADKAEVAASKDAMIFNCAQRAHQNTLETIPIIYVSTLVTGLKYPMFAASACGIWSLSRIAYTRGYITGDPAKRLNYGHLAGMLGMLGLVFGSAYTAGQAVLASL